ncbi:hypothetical protein VP01_1630g1 [Puccinia sorghi]|uniref:Uncharacterized protein n=1 Tax=Puccinia sorghi TaxID=27349 RepID=A0A0L6VGX8_9BASI|nr:hypothetical protein VP01_1630g1 [Puccinia sorghi]
MKKSPPSSLSRSSTGEPNSSVDTYFQQLTSIDLEFFKELTPVYSDFNQTIVRKVRAIIRDVRKLERTGFQCIKRTKKSARTSLPLQSDWLKLIEEKEHEKRREDLMMKEVMYDHHEHIKALPTHQKFSHRLA